MCVSNIVLYVLSYEVILYSAKVIRVCTVHSDQVIICGVYVFSILGTLCVCVCPCGCVRACVFRVDRGGICLFTSQAVLLL